MDDEEDIEFDGEESQKESSNDEPENLKNEDDSEELSDNEINDLLSMVKGDSDSSEENDGDDDVSEDELAAILAGNDESESSDVLGQFDIDALISEATDTKESVIYHYSGRRFGANDKVLIEDYDFANPVFMSERDMRQIRLRHEQYIHHLSARLSMFLRMDFGLKMSKLFTTQYTKYTESISSPTHISLFRLDKFNGVGIVDINPRLAMTVVDRILGGGGHSIRDDRYLTELETVMIEDFVSLLLEEWCRQWTEIVDLTATIIGSESNGRFLQTSPRDAIVLVLSLEATLGDCSEQIQIGLPYYTIEPVIKKMHETSKEFTSVNESKEEGVWSETYEGINVPVTAHWDAFKSSVQDLLMLRPGDVIELPNEILEKTNIVFKNMAHYSGKLGIVDDRVAVEILKRK